MIELQVKPLLDMQDVLVQWSIHLRSGKFSKAAPDRNRNELKQQILGLLSQLESRDFDMCRKGAVRLAATLERTDDSIQIVADVDDLRRRLLDQFESVFFVGLSEQERSMYMPDAPLFGPDVETRFPMMSEDISDAGKCLALSRHTAGVFHLMRVMEIGVRRFGDELGVQLADEKNWQNILDEINKKIKSLDHKLLKTKAFAEAASHLYNVKVAWRNEVMHPKQTYSQEEAAAIFSNTRTFIRDLASLI